MSDDDDDGQAPRVSRRSRGPPLPSLWPGGGGIMATVRMAENGRMVSEPMLPRPLSVVMMGLEDPFRNGGGGGESEVDGRGDGDADVLRAGGDAHDEEEEEDDDDAAVLLGVENPFRGYGESESSDGEEDAGEEEEGSDNASSSEDDEEEEECFGADPPVHQDLDDYYGPSEDDDSDDDDASSEGDELDDGRFVEFDQDDPLREYDSADSDDEDNVVATSGLVSLETATAIMRGVVRLPRYRYRRAAVHLGRSTSAVNQIEAERALVLQRATHAADFRSFVDELDTYEGVRHLELHRGYFGLGDGNDEEEEGPVFDVGDDEEEETGPDPSLRADAPDLERLLGTVLGGHGSLREITFSRCRIQAQCWKLFTESVPNTYESCRELRRLTVDNTPLGLKGCLLLQNMLRRGAVLEQLVLHDCEMDCDGYRAVCDGAAHNHHLDRLVLSGRAVLEPDTLLGAVGPASCLSRLEVTAFALAGGTLKAVTAALRANTELRRLALYAGEGFYDECHVLVEELLQKYNWSLERVATGPWGPYPVPKVRRLLKRNARVRFTHSRLYRVPCRALWPRVLGEVSAFPTLLYRFVRADNVEAFADQVQAAQQALSPSKKRPHS